MNYILKIAPIYFGLVILQLWKDVNNFIVDNTLLFTVEIFFFVLFSDRVPPPSPEPVVAALLLPCSRIRRNMTHNNMGNYAPERVEMDDNTFN